MLDRRIFIIFHQGIAPTITGTDKYPDLVQYYATNTDYKKYILTSNGESELLDKRDDVLLEYRLPRYDASIHKKGFMETSAYIHIYRNRLYLPYKFIGVTQYDMIWNNAVAHRIKSLNQKNKVLAQTSGTILSRGRWHYLMFAERFPLDFLIDSFNKFFNTRYTQEDLKGRPLTLWQTYFMHRSVFEDLSRWLSVLVNEVYPWANRPPYETHWGFLGSLIERAESIFFALRKDLAISDIGLNHSENVVRSLKITKEHYGAKQGPANMSPIEALRGRAKSWLQYIKRSGNSS